MGRGRYRITEPAAPHFMTFTVLEWLPVLTRPDTVGIILEAFAFRQRKRGGQAGALAIFARAELFGGRSLDFSLYAVVDA